jgi:hypothetical protein
MFFLGLEDIFDEFARSHIVGTEPAHNFGIRFYRDTFGKKIFLNHRLQIAALLVRGMAPRRQPFSTLTMALCLRARSLIFVRSATNSLMLITSDF